MNFHHFEQQLFLMLSTNSSIKVNLKTTVHLSATKMTHCVLYMWSCACPHHLHDPCMQVHAQFSLVSQVQILWLYLQKRERPMKSRVLFIGIMQKEKQIEVPVLFLHYPITTPD